MSPRIKLNVLEFATCALIAGGLVVFEHAVRTRVKLEESGEAWVEAAKVKETIQDGVSGTS